MKRTLFNLLPAIFLWLGSCCMAIAQAPVAHSDQITTNGQIIQDDDTGTGTFQAVAVDPSANSDVALVFPATMASKPISIQSLDGGTVTSNGGAPSIRADQSLSFPFQATDQPGVLWVVAIDPNADIDSPRIIVLVQQ